MDIFKELLNFILPDGFDMSRFVIIAIVFIAGCIGISLLGRLAFGRKDTLSHAVSSAIAILCIYIVNIIVLKTNSKLDFILSPLPFVSISGQYMHLFPILHADFNAICTELLNMVILAFIMNLLDSWLPKGKKIVSWYLFRFLSVALAIGLHYLTNMLLANIVPAGIAQFAPTVLLIVLVASVLLGALKYVVSGVLLFIDPLLAFLYAFFFTNLVGRQLIRAVVTTFILTAFVCVLNYLNISSVLISSSALLAYLPFLLVLLVLWYIIGHLFISKKSK